MAALHINEEEFNNLKASGKKLLVDFYADWCGPCNMMAPIVDMIADELEDVEVCKVNVDKFPALALENGISSIPAFLIFKDCELKDRVIGAVSKSQLIAAVNEVK